MPNKKMKNAMIDVACYLQKNQEIVTTYYFFI